MENITSKFISAFNRVVNNDAQKELKNIWDNERTGYTKNISELIRNIGTDIDIDPKLEVLSNYWYLDFIFASEFYDADKFNLSSENWIRKIGIIVEHENEFATTCRELIKLKHWNADLKVIISYPYNDESKSKMFSLYKEILKDCEDNFLFILGYKNKSPMFEFYEYKCDIKPHDIIKI